jgi:CHASE2 domain-containing sensor protein
MQNTRLNNLVDVVAAGAGRWLRNPWRRLSLMVISLLFGIFLGTAVSTTAGQAANWDIIVAALLVLLTESVNWIFYRLNRDGNKRSFWVDLLNGLKIGLTYSMFVEALKLGS